MIASRRFAFAALVLASLLMLSVSDLRACGDKLLLLGSGARYSKLHGTNQPRAILLYKSEKLGHGSAAGDFEAAVKRVGHTVKVAKDMAQIQQALKSEKVDFVVAADSDMASLRAPLAASASKATLVTLTVPAKANEALYVALLDNALKARD